MRKSIFSKIVLVAAVVGMLANQQAQAFVAPAANFVVNRAVAGVITRTAIARGFAANDPRIAATLVGVGKASTALNVASTVAGVGLAIAGAPVWLTVAGGLGVLAAGSAIYAYSKPGNADISLEISDGKLRLSAPLPKNAPYPGASNPGQRDTGMWYFVNRGHKMYRNSGCISTDLNCAGLPPLPSKLPNFSAIGSEGGWGGETIQDVAAYIKDFEIQMCTSATITCTVSPVTVWWVPSADGESFRLASSFTRTDTLTGVATPVGGWLDWVSVQPGVRPVASKYLDVVADNLPTEVKVAKIDETTLAALADQAWKQAAAVPGYTGLPYTMAEPLHDGEAQDWINANPDAVPTVLDLLAPASNPNSQSVPIGVAVLPSSDGQTDPETNPNAPTNVNVVNTPTVNVGNKVQVEFGAAPDIEGPSLEPPSAISILAPILGLLPDLKSYTVPSHVGECPRPTLDVFDWHVKFDAFCDLAEQQRELLFRMSMAAWSIAALVIFLKA